METPLQMIKSCFRTFFCFFETEWIHVGFLETVDPLGRGISCCHETVSHDSSNPLYEEYWRVQEY